MSRVFLEMQPLNVGAHGSFMRVAFAQHSALGVHVLEEKEENQIRAEGCSSGKSPEMSLTP